MQMTLIKWLVFLLAASANGRLLNLRIPDGVPVGERVMKTIFGSCYGKNNLSNPIIIFGDFNGFIGHSSIIRMHSSMKINETYEKLQLSNVGATQIVMIEDSPERLQSNLKLLMKTRWWNHMASFFIISSEKTACKNSKEILMTAWEMNIINSIYICPEVTNTATLYTLNPMANHAPYPWKKMEELTDLNIYSQAFHPSISCENLNYDKTRYINGHQIRATVRLEDKYESLDEFVEYTTARAHYKTFHSIISHLNATAVFKLGSSKANDVVDLENSDSDIFYNLRRLHMYPHLAFLFPYQWEEMLALTRSHEISTLTKIINLWSLKVLLLGFVSLAMLYSILAMRNQSLILAMLDVTRFLVYTSIRSNTRSNSFRIYLIPMFFFIVISNGVFQGKIASFLTKPDKDEPAGTFKQLIHSPIKYNFHGFSPLVEEVEILYPELKVKQVPNDTCIAYALNGSDHVCIMAREFYNRFYGSVSLENVREFIVMLPKNCKCRHNWSLHDRFNNMIIRHVESGIYMYWLKNYTFDGAHRRAADKFALIMEDIRPVYRPVKLNKLDFVFKLLASGLLLATIVFVFELRQLAIRFLVVAIVFVRKVIIRFHY